MFRLIHVRDIHLEITSKCQARCPMCARRIHGGILNPLITLNEITLDIFKKWFDIEFIKQLESLFMCGNLGDPIIAQDTLEIFQYLKSINPNIRLSMHTNGSARDLDWWKQLALVDVRIVFGIDGLIDTHHLYRVSTDWNKIIDNAKAFIEAGGRAEWHMLVFKHNEHQIDDCRKLSIELGFKNFSIKNTSRFHEDKFHVLNEAGYTSHILYPTDTSITLSTKVKQSLKIDHEVIRCKAKKHSQIYIAANGNVSPCCWLDYQWELPNKNTKIEFNDRIGNIPNLNNQTLSEIFDSEYFNKIENTWLDGKPLKECSRQCGVFDRLGGQFGKS